MDWIGQNDVCVIIIQCAFKGSATEVMFKHHLKFLLLTNEQIMTD